MQLRFEQKLTHDQFSEKIGISSRTLRRWESGEREPSLYYIKIIITIFNISDKVFFIFGEERDFQIPKLVYI